MTKGTGNLRERAIHVAEIATHETDSVLDFISIRSSQDVESIVVVADMRLSIEERELELYHHRHKKRRKNGRPDNRALCRPRGNELAHSPNAILAAHLLEAAPSAVFHAAATTRLTLPSAATDRGKPKCSASRTVCQQKGNNAVVKH